MDWEELTPNQFTVVQGYGFMKEYTSFKDFQEDHQKALNDYEKVRSSIGSTALVFNQRHENDLRNRQGTLSEKLEDMFWQRHNIEAVLGYVPVKQRFEQARMELVRLGLLAAIATMTLVWAVNGPEPQSQTIIAVPSAATPYPAIAEPTGSRVLVTNRAEGDSNILKHPLDLSLQINFPVRQNLDLFADQMASAIHASGPVPLSTAPVAR